VTDRPDLPELLRRVLASAEANAAAPMRFIAPDGSATESTIGEFVAGAFGVSGALRAAGLVSGDVGIRAR